MTDNSLPIDRYVLQVASDPKDLNIDFDQLPSITFLANDIENCDVTGHANISHNFNRRNFLRSRIYNFNARSVDFSRVDFKDTGIRDSHFESCDMFATHFNTCTLDDCRFINCAPRETNFNQSSFSYVTFEDCELHNILIKNCVFRNCNFVRCSTNNKLFEYCLLIDCQFVETNIQIQTIQENFGISNRHLISSNIRSDRIRNDYRNMNHADIVQKTHLLSGDNLTAFKLSYFLWEFDNITTLQYLSKAFRIDHWLARCAVVDTFCSLLQGLVDFLIEMYRRDQLPIHAILKIHSVTASLSGALLDEDNIGNNMLIRTVSGVHLQLARQVEPFLHILGKISILQRVKVQLIVADCRDDPKRFYSKLYSPQFNPEVARIVSVTPVNSLELIIDIDEVVASLSFIALLLASRLRFEIVELQGIDVSALEDIRSTKEKHSGLPSVLSVAVGRKSGQALAMELRVKSILPGKLMADLNIDADLHRLSSIRKYTKSISFLFKSTGNAPG